MVDSSSGSSKISSEACCAVTLGFICYMEVLRLMRQYRLPLPEEVPMVFRILPEYIIEDVADFALFSTT